MLGRELLAALFCAVQVIALPLSNQMNEDDAKVMKCIVEVISDTLSKPHPLPISAECLESLRGDDRIVSILRHQNLLKELQELATEGAREREKQEKKSQGFEDELSEVLESQKDRNIERDKSGEAPNEENAFMEAAKEKNEQKSEKDASEEKESNSLEERESLEREANLEEEEDDKQEGEELEHNDVGEVEELEKRDDGVDNHITDDLNDYEPPQKKSEESEVQPKDRNANLELEEEKEHVTEKYQEENKKETEKSIKEQENDHNAFARESHVETDKSSSRSENEEEEEETEQENSITASENQDALRLGVDEKKSEDKDNVSENKGYNYSKDENVMQRGSNSHEKETEEEPSREWEDAKRWNKMDELAKELTSKKRMEEHDSQEDPDRSMKIPFKTHKYDFQSQKSDIRGSGPHHSKEDSKEKGLQISVRLDPEEKKDEEGSANRRTEDQELESLAAIEAELEKVAHKLHELRSG